MLAPGTILARGLLAAASLRSLELSTKTVQTLLYVVLKWNAGLPLSLGIADLARPYCMKVYQGLKRMRRAAKQEPRLVEEEYEVSELEFEESELE